MPFPEENSGNSSSSQPASTAPPAPPPTKNSPRTDLPFPEEEPKKPASNSNPFPEGDSSSNSSSSSSSNSGNDLPADQDANSDPNGAGSKDSTQPQQGRRLLHRVNPIGTKLQTPEEREAEDLDISEYYTQTGDLKGAYLRSQDAVKTAPDDPEAHFSLAKIALKLNKRDEAIAEYQACLKLDPDDKQAKAARKELAKLKP